MAAARLRLIVWNAAEAAQKAAILRAAGYQVDHEVPADYRSQKPIRDNPPAAVLIDLSRAPAKGRDVALSLRKIPIVFLNGTPTKYPNPTCATWDTILDALKNLPPPPRAPKSALDAYAGVPLLKKLAIKPGMTVNLLGAPPGFEDTLGDLPESVKLRHDTTAKSDLTLWFVRSQSELDRELTFLAVQRLWIIWRKKSPGITQRTIRESARAAGYVDYKIASIDQTWSGMLFALRTPPMRNRKPRRGPT
jgi:hypothetical protein